MAVEPDAGAVMNLPPSPVRSPYRQHLCMFERHQRDRPRDEQRREAIDASRAPEAAAELLSALGRRIRGSPHALVGDCVMVWSRRLIEFERFTGARVRPPARL